MNMLALFKPATLVALIFGVCVGGILTFIWRGEANPDEAAGSEAAKPLYWVAPMDPNYRRDKPGKSPMGMDLIPVYDQAQSADSAAAYNAGPGTIMIDASVVNNLGVRTATVQRKTLKEKIFTVGYVKYDANKLIHIHPRVSGWIDKLYVTATGDPTQQGEPLYALYSPELVNAQEELLLALNRNNQQLLRAAQDRLEALHIPASFVEKLKQSKVVEQSVTFYSPQDGFIDNLNIREGFYVQPGTTLFIVGAIDRVWVEVEVFERQASLVKQGEAVSMTLDYLPGVTWQGKVDYIYPTLDQKTRTMRLRVEFDNPEKKLLPNMFAQVVIHSESEEALLVIPREALIRTGIQDRVVLALGEGRFKSVEVKVGRQDREQIEILAGLAEGETVVTSAQFLLDSESSKTSDFVRINAQPTAKQQEMPAPASESAWVEARINQQFADTRTVSVSHQAIEAWQMMAMTMNFSVAPDLDFERLKPGTELHIEIQKGDAGLFEIIGIHLPQANTPMGRE